MTVDVKVSSFLTKSFLQLLWEPRVICPLINQDITIDSSVSSHYTVSVPTVRVIFLSLTWHAKSRNLLDTMRETEYRKLKQRIEAESREKLEALELVWKMSGGSNGKSPASESLASKTKGQLVSNLKTFLQAANNDFTITDVQSALRPILGVVRRQSIATALRRQKNIEVVVAGKGRTEAKYRKKI